MNIRNFDEWISTLKNSICDYKYYVNFDTVIENVNKVKVELNILNTLIASKDIENEFEKIVSEYPNTLKCIPILLAVRSYEIDAIDDNGLFIYNFNDINQDIKQYQYFMRETGLFDLLENHLIGNLYDYVTGVEAGLNSNARKNRGGHLMENTVEKYIKKLNVEYEKEMTSGNIKKKWNVDISSFLNQGKTIKRFDFVIKHNDHIILIETNFYKSSGSKLQETARSYKNIAIESKALKNVTFVWITDGHGWYSSRNNLFETFGTMDHLYNINDLDNNALGLLLEHLDT